MASYKKLKSGWQYRVSYKDDDGKYRTKSENGFRTKGEAQIKAEKVERLLRGGHKISSDVTFADYMQDWYETYKKDVHSKSNNIDIELSIKQVKKYFKNTKLSDVTRHQYQSFLNWYGETRATASVRKVHIYAKACLLDAMEEKRINRDPTYKIVPKGTVPPKKDEDKFMSYEDTQKLLKEVYKGLNPTWHSRYMIIIALATGMRFSEILALSWDDINFKNQTIRINKSFDYRITNEFAKTKTPSSRRIIPIDEETLDVLRKFKEFNDPAFGNYLFIKETNNGYEHVTNTAANKTLRRACKRAGVKVISFHSLRHTFCSLLIYLGLNIKFISRLLGHSSVEITYNIYGHLIEEMETQETGKMNEFLIGLHSQDK